jgi:hypothetical protein
MLTAVERIEDIRYATVPAAPLLTLEASRL